jgi:hypothetical protein
MCPQTVEIKCPRFPDHVATRRLLATTEREQFRDDVEGDVYEIDCPVCGKYEALADQCPTES